MDAAASFMDDRPSVSTPSITSPMQALPDLTDAEPQPSGFGQQKSTLVSLWRKRSAAARSGQLCDLRAEAAMWRQLGHAVRLGVSGFVEEEGPFRLLQSTACIVCRVQSSDRKKLDHCMCFPKNEDEKAVPHDISSTGPRSRPAETQPGDEAVDLLRECIHRFCHGTVSAVGPTACESPKLVRAWRPINPIAGASIAWRRRENVHWRLFWAAESRKRAMEESEKRSIRSECFNCPPTPSNYSELEVPLGEDDLDFDDSKGISHQFIRETSGGSSQTFNLDNFALQSLQSLQCASRDQDPRLDFLQQRNAQLELRVAVLEEAHRHLEAELHSRAESEKSLLERVSKLEMTLHGHEAHTKECPTEANCD